MELVKIIKILLAALKQDRRADVAFDDKDGEGKWITMNGTPVKVDDKGKPVAGPSNVVEGGGGGPSSGKSSPQTAEEWKKMPPVNEPGSKKVSTDDIPGMTKALKENFEADKRFAGSDTNAVDAFYVRELGGRTMELRTEKGMQEVFFGHEGRRKVPQNVEVDPIKRDLVPHIPEIIASGEFIGEPPAYKFHRKFEKFGHYKKMLPVQGDPSKRVAVIVDVGIDAMGRHEYNMYNMTARSPGSEKRFDYKERGIRESVRRERAAKKKIGGDSGLRAVFIHCPSESPPTKDSIPDAEWAVNIRIAECWDTKTGKRLHEFEDAAQAEDKASPDRLTFDAASKRRFDENGFLHVEASPISKEAVNDYYGHEIPGHDKLGLNPTRIYKGYRPGEELRKAAATFNGLNILSEHIKDNAEDPPKDYIVGSMGTDARFSAPYLMNSLIIKDAEAIELLNPADPDKAPKREISASYRYDPVFKAGTRKIALVFSVWM